MYTEDERIVRNWRIFCVCSLCWEVVVAATNIPFMVLKVIAVWRPRQAWLVQINVSFAGGMCSCIGLGGCKWGCRKGAFGVLDSEQWWRSGASTRLPPIWPGLKSRFRRHTLVEFVVCSLLCSERFFSGYSGFPLSSKNQHFQIPVRPGIRLTKNHYVDVLPPNRYLFICYFI